MFFNSGSRSNLLKARDSSISSDSLVTLIHKGVCVRKDSESSVYSDKPKCFLMELFVLFVFLDILPSYRYLSPIVLTSGKCIFACSQNKLALCNISDTQRWDVSYSNSNCSWWAWFKTICDAPSSPSFVDQRLYFLFDWLLTMSLSYLFVFSSFLCSSFIDSSCLLHVPFKNLHAFSIFFLSLLSF